MTRLLIRTGLLAMVCISYASAAHGQIFGGEAGWTQGVTVSTNFLGATSGQWLVDQLNIVRVSVDDATRIRPVLAGHLLYDVSDKVSIGPGLAVALGEDLVDGLGFQFVVGLKRARPLDSDDNPQEPDLFTLGFGVWVRTADVLAPEFTLDQLAPFDPDTNEFLPIRTVRQGLWSAQLTVTMRLFNR